MNKTELTKENIYLPLDGMSVAELTELYNFLKLLNYATDSFDSFLTKKYLHFNTNFNRWWTFSTWSKEENKQEVTIQQLKEILQPMENKEFDLKGYSVEVDNEEQAKQLQELAFKQGFEWYNGKKIQRLNEKFFSFNAFNENEIKFDFKHFKDEYVTKEIHFNDIFKETLEQQLEKAKAEVKRLEDEIEESKIKIGDWVIHVDDNIIRLVENENDIKSAKNNGYIKITDQELINKLNTYL